MNGIAYNSELIHQTVIHENMRGRETMLEFGHSMRCIRHNPSKDAHIADMVTFVRAKENGLLCEVRFPVTSIRRRSEILHFCAQLYEHLPVGGMCIIPSKYLACISFELGLVLDDQDDADVLPRLEQMLDYAEAVMQCIAEPLLGVICGDDPHEAAEACIPNLPVWTGDFMPVKAMDMKEA